MEQTGFDREKGFAPQIIHREGAVVNPERGQGKVKGEPAQATFPCVAVSAVCSSTPHVAAHVPRRKPREVAPVGGSWRGRHSPYLYHKFKAGSALPQWLLAPASRDRQRGGTAPRSPEEETDPETVHLFKVTNLMGVKGILSTMPSLDYSPYSKWD